MKPILLRMLAAACAAVSLASGQSVTTYTNFVRQVQLPTGVQYDASVAPTGSGLSSLAINPGGARFELWTVSSPTVVSYLLDTEYVGTYVPIAAVQIDSEDTYGEDLTNTSTIPVTLPAMVRRTRADRPFTVYVTVSGLLNGVTDPVAEKSVNLFHHVQSYGVGGTGVNLDRTQATILTQVSVAQNGLQTLNYSINAVPGSNRSKVRGEERFSVFTLDDYQAPASQVASRYIQIWPVADGTISGVAQNQLIRFSMPTLTLTLNDLYPTSSTYLQVYKGNPVLGTTGTLVSGSHLNVNDSVPNSRVLTVSNYDTAFSGDGLWTMELLTVTPFGVDRLAYVSFTLNRTIEVNGTVTTIE